MVRIARVAERALALEATDRVQTDRVVPAHLLPLATLVNVLAVAVRKRAEPFRAGAVANAARNRDAFRAARTLAVRRAAVQHAVALHQLVRRCTATLRTVALVARLVRIAIEPGRTPALVAAGQVFAERVHTARRLAAVVRTLVHIATAPLRVALVALPADAHTIAAVRVLHTLLPRRAGVALATRVQGGLGAAARVGIAGASARTLTGVTAGEIRTHRSTRTRVGSTLVDVHALTRLAGETLTAQTLCASARHQHTVRVRPTGHLLARMATVIADVRLRTQTALLLIAHRIARTVRVLRTGNHTDTPHTRIRIGNRARRTAALMRSVEVLAERVRAARTGAGTLVHILALACRIARIPGRAGTAVAARVVRADCVQAAPPVRALGRITLVNVDAAGPNVGRVERPPLLADAERFLALRLAVRVLTTLHVRTGRFARHSGRRSDEARLTLAPVRAGRVHAHRRRSAGGLLAQAPRATSTLVHVDTHRALRLEPVLTEALTLDALRIVGAVEGGRAQHVHVRLFAGHFRVRPTHVPLRAETVVPGRRVLADRVLAARLLVRAALVYIDAAPERVAGVFWFA